MKKHSRYKRIAGRLLAFMEARKCARRCGRLTINRGGVCAWCLDYEEEQRRKEARQCTKA